MALPTVLRSPSANDDLDQIFDYLSAEMSPELAAFVIARLFEAMHRAAANPFGYRERREYPRAPRRINASGYAVIYQPLFGEDGIIVLRVIHARRDIPRRLQDDHRDAA